MTHHLVTFMLPIAATSKGIPPEGHHPLLTNTMDLMVREFGGCAFQAGRLLARSGHTVTEGEAIRIETTARGYKDTASLKAKCERVAKLLLGLWKEPQLTYTIREIEHHEVYVTNVT